MPNYIQKQEAIRALPEVARILVVGCSGGGKTTLSKRLSTCLNLEYLSLDRDVRWLPGWTAREKTSQRRIIEDLVRRPRWIMDGTSTSSFDIRLPRTDLVLWVRVPRRVALAGLAVRVTKHLGTTRPDMAEGCPEPIPDREFLSFIWNFEKKYSPQIKINLDEYGPRIPVLVLNSRSSINQLVKEIENR